MKAKLPLALLLAALSLPAAALDLDQAMRALGPAKAAGLLGEQADGYLGVVKSEGEAEAIAAQINQARRAEYRRVADRNGVAMRDVELLAGQKAIDKTPKGQYVLQGGRWVRK